MQRECKITVLETKVYGVRPLCEILKMMPVPVFPDKNVRMK